MSSTGQVRIYSFRCNCVNGERAMQPWQVEEHLLCEGEWQQRERHWGPIACPITLYLDWAANQGFPWQREWKNGKCICANIVRVIFLSIYCFVWSVVSESNMPFAVQGERGVHMSAQQNSLECELILRPFMHEVICFIIAAESLLMPWRDAAACQPSGNENTIVDWLC